MLKVYTEGLLTKQEGSFWKARSLKSALINENLIKKSAYGYTYTSTKEKYFQETHESKW